MSYIETEGTDLATIFTPAGIGDCGRAGAQSLRCTSLLYRIKGLLFLWEVVLDRFCYCRLETQVRFVRGEDEQF
jgi:hypothetical protein